MSARVYDIYICVCVYVMTFVCVCVYVCLAYVLARVWYVCVRGMYERARN